MLVKNNSFDLKLCMNMELPNDKRNVIVWEKWIKSRYFHTKAMEFVVSMSNLDILSELVIALNISRSDLFSVRFVRELLFVNNKYNEVRPFLFPTHQRLSS